MIKNDHVKLFSNASKIALIGNGGNLAIAQHMASDIYRHTGKFCFAPDSISLTALGGDGDWKDEWIKYANECADLIIGITCRVNSPLALELEKISITAPYGGSTETLLISPIEHENIETIIIESTHYHEFEIKALSIIYELMEKSGVVLPELPNEVQRYDDITEKKDDIYCIDIDGTLTEPHDGSPWDAIPRRDRIRKVNKLHDNGATIYLMTARGFIHSTGRYPKDIHSQQREADYHCRSRTEAQLASWGVKYHKLFFGKPRAKHYIDDRSQTDSYLDRL
tara:strand:+ start:906 stop:1748 length:843 start_codon:yes stop_codon:yes gene_type:complete